MLTGAIEFGDCAQAATTGSEAMAKKVLMVMCLSRVIRDLPALPVWRFGRLRRCLWEDNGVPIGTMQDKKMPIGTIMVFAMRTGSERLVLIGRKNAQGCKANERFTADGTRLGATGQPRTSGNLRRGRQDA